MSEFDRDNLLMPDVFLKEFVTVLESNKTISVYQYTNDNGFYVALQDDEYAIIGNYDWLSVKNDKTDQKGWYISNSKFVAAERDKIVMAQ